MLSFSIFFCLVILLTVYIYRLKKVPIHELSFVSMVTIEVKSSLTQENVSICLCNSLILMDFLKLSMVQACLNHPRGHLSFLQNKIFKIAGFSQIVSCYIAGCHIATQLENWAASGTRIKAMM